VESDSVVGATAGLAPAELAPVSPMIQQPASVASATPIDHARICAFDTDSHADTSPSFLVDVYSAALEAGDLYRDLRARGQPTPAQNLECDLLVSRLLRRRRLLATLDREQ
jgi:hypothetical protein